MGKLFRETLHEKKGKNNRHCQNDRQDLADEIEKINQLHDMAFNPVHVYLGKEIELQMFVPGLRFQGFPVLESLPEG